MGRGPLPPQETIDTIRALAMWTTWKTAVVDIPLGGSMGGVVCEPHRLGSDRAGTHQSSWIRKVSRSIGPRRDVTGAGHDDVEPAHDLDARRVRDAARAKIAGRGHHRQDPRCRRLHGRLQAAGYGLVYTLREALKELGIEAGSTTASVQGFGSVAQHAIELYCQIGGTVTCVSSWDPPPARP